MAINAQQLQGQWNNLRGQVKEKWGQLTDDDLQLSEGNVDQLVGKIQQRTGEGREAIEHYLTDLVSRGSSTISNLTENAGQFAQQATERLRDSYGQVADQARQRLGDATNMVRSNPSESVAVAFGIGIAAGLLLGLAMKSR